MTSPQSEKLRTRTLCVRRGLGRELNKPETHPFRTSGSGVFFAFVYTKTLLASIFFLGTLSFLLSQSLY